MATRVFFLNRLRDGVAGEDYERWVREVDYPKARSLPTMLSYTVTRLEGFLRDDEGDLPCDYLEVAEVTDLQEYRAAIAGMPGRERFVEELRSFIGDVTAVHGTVVE